MLQKDFYCTPMCSFRWIEPIGVILSSGNAGELPDNIIERDSDYYDD